MNCEQIQETLVSVLAGEPVPGWTDLERHVSRCSDCSAAARELSQTWALLGREADRPLPVMSRLRIAGNLTRAADAEASGAAWRPHSGRTKRGARQRLHAASWVALGVLVFGSALTGYFALRPAIRENDMLADLVKRGDLDRVEVQVDEERSLVHLTLSMPKETKQVSGRPEEARIQDVLTQLVTDETTRSSTRGRAVQALSGTENMSATVRVAMVQALLSDPNPSVRLKAAEALMGEVDEPEVQQAFLKVLGSDPNPGLRVRAIDAILAAPEITRQPATIDALRQAATAPNSQHYVRIRAAEFLRGL